MAKLKKITHSEMAFVEYMADTGIGPIQAARHILGWKCETGTREVQKAQDLARSARAFRYRQEYLKKKEQEAEVENAMSRVVRVDDLRDFAFKRLKAIAESKDNNSQVRFNAIKALESLMDPTKDLALIMKWVSLVWRGLEAHCPRCHNSFPLWKVENKKVKEYLESQGEAVKPLEESLDRRLELFRQAEKRKQPHPGQLKVLGASERHIVCTGAARCLEENERIVLSDGRVLPIKDLVGTYFEVIAFGVLGEQVKSKAWAEYNGIKPVYKIITENGKEIVRTGNHPLLCSYKKSYGQGHTTQIGTYNWKNVEDIKPNDLVAIPKILKINGKKRRDNNEVKLLGYLLGDGCITKSISFTQKDGIAKEEFKQLIKYFNCEFRECSDGLTLVVRGKRFRDKIEKNYILDIVKSWGIYGKKSIDKYFPDWVWELPNDQLALLINRLYACDGWSHNGQISIGLSSVRMIRDIELALLRLGIVGRFRLKKSFYKKNNSKRNFRSWCYDIARRDESIKFMDIVGIYGKDDQVKKSRLIANNRNIGKDFWKTSGLPDGYEWAIIRDVILLGERKTINITVDTYHTFLTTFVEHNSGKSLCLSVFAYLSMLIPGVESWLIAQTYDAARKEVEYLKKFLRTAFYPYYDHLFKEIQDSKTGELILTSRWGSELRVRSSKSKGSITASELELAMIAEPGWVEDIYEEVRARVSSRLGRIILMGTPKGFGGVLGRAVNLVGRDPKTGKVVRIPPEKRTIAYGCKWDTSMLFYKMDPRDNPEYVKSELAAARMELTDTEYASEFEGEMAAEEGSKFPQIKPIHCIKIPRSLYDNCIFITGVDQGPKNFAWVILGWDGKNIISAYEKFDTDERTMKSKILSMRNEVKNTLLMIGGNPENWKGTIFDTHPPITNELAELDREGYKWPTEVFFKHINASRFKENWRWEACEYVNEMALQKRLIFDVEHCYLLHDQLMRAIDAPPKDGMAEEIWGNRNKGWKIYDPQRGDHNADAFLMAVWSIMISAVQIDPKKILPSDPWTEQKNAFAYDFISNERAELSGEIDRSKNEELWEEMFGRPRSDSKSVIPNNPYYHWPDY